MKNFCPSLRQCGFRLLALEILSATKLEGRKGELKPKELQTALLKP